MQYYEVNNFRIRSSNSQQLESKCIDHPWTLEKKGKEGVGGKKKFCNCHSLICDAHGEQIASINPTTFSSQASSRLEAQLQPHAFFLYYALLHFLVELKTTFSSFPQTNSQCLFSSCPNIFILTCLTYDPQFGFVQAKTE